MAWWRRKKEPLQKQTAQDKVSVPKGLWSKCESCGEITYTDELIQNLRVCPVCGHHAPMPTHERIASMIDGDTWEEHDQELRSGDPLEFVDSKPYAQRVDKAVSQSGLGDAFIAGLGDVDGVPVSAGFFAFEFMGGSMGSVVGEKVTRVFERALTNKRPAIVFSASGGARMQEGVLSLMQMAKTSAARARLRDEKLPYVSVVLHPTTGGVAASFAMLGDIIIAEPRALVGFAGPRVIQQTIGQELPKGFQRAEFPAGARDGRSHREPPRAARTDRIDAASAAGQAGPSPARMKLESLFERRALGIKLGLQALREPYARLQRPGAGLPAVHIVGTNGKGTTAHLCAHALGRRGHRIGLYTSPHLHRVVERVRVDGVPIAEPALVAAVERVLAVEPREGPRPLSFFEVLTLAGLVAFADAGVDALVVEAGLGGRLDATRLVDASVHVITSIALDHTAVLGSTLAAIAGEKVAVVAPNVPCLSGPLPPEAMAVVRRVTAEVGAPLRVLPAADNPREQNAALALAAAQIVDGRVDRSDLDGARVPGRLERIDGFILDIAHNPAAIEALVATVAALKAPKLVVAFGCLRDKDGAAMNDALMQLGCPRWWVPPEPGLAAPAAFDRSFAGPRDETFWELALTHVQGGGGSVLVCGSARLVGEIRARLLNEDAVLDPSDPRV